MAGDQTVKTELGFSAGETKCMIDGKVPVCVSGLSSMAEGSWSPPHMLVAATETCFFLTLQYVVNKMHLNLLSYSSTAEGKLTAPDGKHTEVSEIIIRPKIEIEGGADKAKLEKICSMAEDYCLVAKSLKSKVMIEIA